MANVQQIRRVPNAHQLRSLLIAHDVFVKHFGTAYAETYSKDQVWMLACGFTAAFDLQSHPYLLSKEGVDMFMEMVTGTGK